MVRRGVSRAVLLRAGAGALAGNVVAACGAFGRETPPSGTQRSYQGVVLQHLVKDTSAPLMRNLERAVNELFLPPRAGAKVELIPGTGGYWQKLLTLLASDTPPDTAEQDEYFMAYLITRNQLLELGPHQAKDKGFNAKGMFEGAWRAGHYRDKLYGIAEQMFGPILLFNKDHFDDAGLPYPPADWKQSGWTWNRLREDAKKLVKRDGSGGIARAGFGWDAAFLSRFSGHFYAYGARVFDRLDDPTKCVLDEPRSLELIQLLYDMRFRDQSAAPADWYGGGNGRPGSNGGLFRQGKLAIAVTLDELAATRNTDLRWDYAPLPRPNAGGKAGGFVGANVFTAMRTTKQPELAWEWIATVGGPTYAEWKMRDAEVLHLPSWKTLQQEFAKLQPPERVHVNVDIGDYATSSVMSTVYVELQDAILDGLKPAWKGEAPVPQVVADVVRQANELLRQAPK